MILGCSQSFLLNHLANLSQQLHKPNMNSMEAFLAKELQEFWCDTCNRKFRKESDLNLHKQTHLIEEQQNARQRAYQCGECKTNFKSKVLLNKHIESVHQNLSENDEFGSFF